VFRTEPTREPFQPFPKLAREHLFMFMRSPPEVTALAWRGEKA
jgi:hypothetical protein